MHTETLQQFYVRTGQPMPAELASQTNVSHFNVKQRTCLNRLTPYNRRDYYKICLIIGNGMHIAEDKETPVENAAIIFSNPRVPSAYRGISESQSGYYCLFNDTFLLNSIRQEIRYRSALFNPSIQAVISLDAANIERFKYLFGEMEGLLSSTYTYKSDMIRTLLQMIILEGIRIQGPVNQEHSGDRLISRFLELLNQQFPVDSPENPLRLFTPAAYASQLNVHVNHLNNVLKRSTGKTTREIIHERIVEEAKTLLLNTDWDAAQIAYTLGFEYPSHFNKYFKQNTQTTPLLFREQLRQAI
ncbi:AraC family transcriptional regulator [Dyadobacter beijingensis]|uniref:AraC family transcriptional regulator n=1 Tax=Dyadobacter beijingensis TaxID=365489 RepID=A0ABQ2I359_9BACT|nr:helix-turn-helix domain-containing protein [Dyadobacter beijingensis]GGM95857.1 AraC family transcriptional regulator [Dyadobacter beijingensis]